MKVSPILFLLLFRQYTWDGLAISDCLALVLQGSVATCLRCGEIFNDIFIANYSKCVNEVIIKIG